MKNYGRKARWKLRPSRRDVVQHEPLQRIRGSIFFLSRYGYREFRFACVSAGSDVAWDRKMQECRVTKNVAAGFSTQDDVHRGR